MNLTDNHTATAQEVDAKPAQTSIDAEKSGNVQEDISSAGDSENDIQLNPQDEEKGIGGHEQERVVVDTAAESRLLKKLDYRMIPLLFALCKCILIAIDGIFPSWLLTTHRSSELSRPF
jgi:hypothetical protein